MVVEKLVKLIDPGESVIICKGNEMRGIFPGRFIPSMYYKEKIQLITYDKDQKSLKIYIGECDE